MKVYLAEVTYPYEVGYTVGVYSTREKAHEAILRDNGHYGDTLITEWELDKVYKNVDSPTV